MVLDEAAAEHGGVEGEEFFVRDKREPVVRERSGSVGIRLLGLLGGRHSKDGSQMVSGILRIVYGEEAGYRV